MGEWSILRVEISCVFTAKNGPEKCVSDRKFPAEHDGVSFDHVLGQEKRKNRLFRILTSRFHITKYSSRISLFYRNFPAEHDRTSTDHARRVEMHENSHRKQLICCSDEIFPFPQNHLIFPSAHFFSTTRNTFVARINYNLSRLYIIVTRKMRPARCV